MVNLNPAPARTQHLVVLSRGSGHSVWVNGLVLKLSEIDRNTKDPPAGEFQRDPVALIGGVGGTVTVLSYGYWIREEGREGEGELARCRIDLGSGYVMTALFGMAMVVIGATIDPDTNSKGSTLLVQLGAHIEARMGPVGRWAFLLGAWSAVFTSLFGVWQAVPYLFADVVTRWRRSRKSSRPTVVTQATVAGQPMEAALPAGSPEVSTRSPLYRTYLVLLALVPMLGLFVDFKEAQRLYATIGTWFLPMLALALLVMNSRRDWIGDRLRNHLATNLVLVATLAFFSWIAWERLGE